MTIVAHMQCLKVHKGDRGLKGNMFIAQREEKGGVKRHHGQGMEKSLWNLEWEPRINGLGEKGRKTKFIKLSLP